MLNTPVLFLIFNRPDLTEKVFSVIRQAQPKQLFIAADGPREDKIGEIALCAETRKTVMNRIDWDCEVHTLFREKNIGCKIAVSAAITWFFENVEEGIILEDDCLPDISFFQFCEELLIKYRNNENIMHIGGDYFLNYKIRESYYITKYTHIWGWATWRRAWKFYDVEMTKWEQIDKKKFLRKHCTSRDEIEFWYATFCNVHNNEFNTWDHQWTFTCWLNNSLSIAPSVNLVSNIGFSEAATHTKSLDAVLSNVKVDSIGGSIIHPSKLAINMKADKLIGKNIYLRREGIFKYYFNKIKKMVKWLIQKD